MCKKYINVLWIRKQTLWDMHLSLNGALYSMNNILAIESLHCTEIWWGRVIIFRYFTKHWIPFTEMKLNKTQMYNYTTVDKSNSCIIKTIRFHCTEPADTNYSCYFSFNTFIMKIRFLFRYGKSVFPPFLCIIVLWITHQITVGFLWPF